VHVITVCNFNAKWEYQIAKYTIIICKVSQRGMKLRVLPSLHKLSLKSLLACRRVSKPALKIGWNFLDFVRLSNFERILKYKIRYAHKIKCPKYRSYYRSRTS
jgi:hypothetical protein